MGFLQPSADLYSCASATPPRRMSRNQDSSLDIPPRRSQYMVEKLRIGREAGASSYLPTDPKGQSPDDSVPSPPREFQSYSEHNYGNIGGQSSQQRDALAEARSTIRKSSTATPVRRRISRACDQCNQLRTKCDGQQPCVHCLGSYFRERVNFNFGANRC